MKLTVLWFLECYDYGCILLFSFIAVIQIALAILSFSGVREGDSTDSVCPPYIYILVDIKAGRQLELLTF